MAKYLIKTNIIHALYPNTFGGYLPYIRSFAHIRQDTSSASHNKHSEVEYRLIGHRLSGVDINRILEFTLTLLSRLQHVLAFI